MKKIFGIFVTSLCLLVCSCNNQNNNVGFVTDVPVENPAETTEAKYMKLLPEGEGLDAERAAVTLKVNADMPIETTSLTTTTSDSVDNVSSVISISDLFDVGVYAVFGVEQTDGCDYFVFTDDNSGRVVKSNGTGSVDFTCYGDSHSLLFRFDTDNSNDTLLLKNVLPDCGFIVGSYVKDDTTSEYIFDFLPDEDPETFEVISYFGAGDGCCCGCSDSSDSDGCYCGDPDITTDNSTDSGC